MPRVLAISSQVARGAVGLSSIVPVLQALGHEVVALPTILLSNHPGHARSAGERVAPDLLTRMLETLDANGWLAGIDALITGYLPSAEHVAVAREAVERVRRRRADALYLCDPVLGDEPKGLYIAEAAAGATRDRLVPLADCLKLNRFELGWLAGAAIDAPAVVLAAGRRLGVPVVAATSVSLRAEPQITNLVITVERARSLTVARRSHAPNGTGDAFGGLMLGYRLAGSDWPEAAARATAAVDLMLEASVGHDELAVVPVLAGLRRIAPHPLEPADGTSH
jgi:pyridoxine kinase